MRSHAEHGNEKKDKMSRNTLRRLVLKGRYVFPVTSKPVADGFVVVEGDRIVSAGAGDVGMQSKGEKVFDLGNVAILPGLVNAHAHLDFSEFDSPLGERGIGFVDWIKLAFDHRRRTTTSMRQVVALGLEESVRCGVTALGDITQPDRPPVDDLLKKGATAGLPSSAGRNPRKFTAGQASSGTQIPPEVTSFLELKALTAAGVADAMAKARSHVQRDLAGLSPHAPFSVHPELLTAVVELSAAKRIPVAMHLAESSEEMEFLRDGGGPFRAFLEGLGYGASGGTLTAHFARPMDYLRRLATAHRALVVHGNYLDDEEIAFLGANASRMSVVYCPRSHDWFAHAEYPLRKMLAVGATVALGTDGRCSTPDLSLLEEMRFVARRHPGVRLDTILRMGTLYGASALGREEEIGSLSPGKRADLAIVALPERDAADPHELIFDSTEPVVGCYCRGVAWSNDAGDR